MGLFLHFLLNMQPHNKQKYSNFRNDRDYFLKYVGLGWVKKNKQSEEHNDVIIDITHRILPALIDASPESLVVESKINLIFN